MASFEELLISIAAHPGMYVGNFSLRNVRHYLSGYCHGLNDAGQPDPLRGWMRWIEMKFLIAHSAWGWERILEHAYGSEKAALDAMPALYREFAMCIEESGEEGIAEEHRRQFMAAYGKVWHEPESTKTTSHLG